MWWLYLLIVLQIFWTGDISRNKRKNLIEVTVQPDHVNHDQRCYDRSALLTIREQIGRNSMFNRIPYTAVKNIRSLKLNKTRVKKRRNRKIKYVPRVNLNNLSDITPKTDGHLHTDKLRIATINVRSLRNKDSVIYNYLLEQGLDVAVLTETWISDNDKQWLNSLDFVQNGFQLHSVHRVDRRGGGVTIMIRPGIKCNLVHHEINNIMELVIVHIRTKIPMTILGLYHPPFGSTVENTPTSFNDAITNVLTEWMPTRKNWLLLGDFNVNLSDVTSNEVCVFKDTMEALGLKQHVQLATHINGHILDQVYSEEHSQFTVMSARPDIFISDHKSVIVSTSVIKEKLKRQQITVRKIKHIDVQSLNETIQCGKHQLGK